jgi:putative transposase
MKGYNIKIYPNKEQQILLDKNFGAVRWTYNQMIVVNQKRYHRTGKGLSGYDMQSYLPKLKKQYKWLAAVNSQSLQIACQQLDKAYTRFFKKQGGYPKFKKKNSKNSFSCITNCQLLEKHIKLPKLGLIKFRGGTKPQGIPKTFTISKDATGYYASIIFDNGKQEVQMQEINNVIGIDVGIKDFATLSNGVVIPNQKFLLQSQKKLKKLQQKFARQEKTSKKRQQTKILIARLHKKIANQRKDFNHKISRAVVNMCENQTHIATENLNIQGMMANHKLAKSIADVAWSQFLNFLQYKSIEVGKYVLKVGTFFPSSKICSSCGVVNKSLTLAMRVWTCKECGVIHSRDFNASKNIAMESIRNWCSKHQGGEKINLEMVLQNIKSSSLVEADKLYLKV